MENEPIKLDVISGFLGVGKTTFILKMLQSVCRGERVAVLENEFGKIGLDGALLSEGQPLAVKEIASGCICCELSGPFEDGIFQLIEQQQPDRIIVEPTGVARLSDVLATLQRPEIAKRCILERVITIVDASRLAVMEQMAGMYFEDQLRNCGAVAVSKTQGMTMQNIASMADRIDDYAPEVAIFTQEWTDQNVEAICAASNLLHPVVHLSAENEIPFVSTTIELTKPVRPKQLAQMVSDLDGGEFGQVLRVKALFRDNMGGWRVLQAVTGECRIQAAPGRGNSAITFIGRNLDIAGLRRHFGTLAGTVPVGRLRRKIIVDPLQGQ